MVGDDHNNKFLLYTAPDGNVHIEVAIEDETVWLTQKAIAELFCVEVQTINYHLKEVFKSGELVEDSVIRKIRITAADGKKYLTNFYNLDAIISVGYRVNSIQATHFRKWATKTLREFLVKGFVLDDERLKQGKTLFSKDYFDELLERIREIRASEHRLYQKITDIYAQCSIDYDPDSEITQSFYKTVQNKLHWDITSLTAAELIAKRADAEKRLPDFIFACYVISGGKEIMIKAVSSTFKDKEECSSILYGPESWGRLFYHPKYH